MTWGRAGDLELPARPERVPASRRVALLGLPRTRRNSGAQEPMGPMEQAGLDVIGPFPFDADFAMWRAMRTAGHTFVCDRSLYPKLVKVLESDGQQVHQVPLPTGVAQTDAYYTAVGEATGVGEALDAANAPAREAAVEALDAFRERYEGLRVALGIRMLNNYEADQLAYQGLGDFEALAELGFQLTLVVQGPQDRRDRIARLLERRGIAHPFEMFPEPWDLSGVLGGGRFDVAYMADHCRGECRRAGVPLIPSRALDPWYGGVPRYLEWLDRLLREVVK